MDYEIRYSSATHMFEVVWRGIVIDTMLPTYGDGETTIQLHQALAEADAAQGVR